ncbi:MAG TPA: ABC transporter permease, partial [Nitrospirota bacterium]|nr:ABC transporter permease [Nitrospirota bacterium]
NFFTMLTTITLRELTSNKPALVAASLLVLLLLTAVIGPVLVTYDPLAMDLDNVKQPPGKIHLLGTDGKGRDVLSRMVYGSRISLAVGVIASVLSLCIGIFFGLLAGYFGGKVDALCSQVFDIFLAFPSLLLAIGISAVMQAGLMSAMLAITLVGWAGFARFVRGITISLKEQTYIEASRALGASPARILYRHILPNAIPLILVAGSLRVGGFILLEAALSFLGLGVQPPTPTWGSMISLNRSYINSAPWIIIFPGLAISVTVISFNILGDFLRDKLDPRMRI